MRVSGSKRPSFRRRFRSRCCLGIVIISELRSINRYVSPNITSSLTNVPDTTDLELFEDETRPFSGKTNNRVVLTFHGTYYYVHDTYAR